MKKLLMLFFVCTGLLLQACDRTNSGDEYDISPSLPPYVELSAKTVLEAKEGATVNVPIRLRTGLPQPVTVQYEITGAYSATGTATIPAFTLQANAPLNIGTGIVKGSSTTADATFTIKSATMGTQALTVGHKGAELEKRIIRISK